MVRQLHWRKEWYIAGVAVEGIVRGMELAPFYNKNIMGYTRYRAFIGGAR